MRLAFALILFATPAHALDFSCVTPDFSCVTPIETETEYLPALSDIEPVTPLPVLDVTGWEIDPDCPTGNCPLQSNSTAPVRTAPRRRWLFR